MEDDLNLAWKVARRLVRAAPELTGFAKPRHWWVYLGDMCIDGHPYTQEQAERAAEVLRPDVVAYLLWMLRLARSEVPVRHADQFEPETGFAWEEIADLRKLIVEQNQAAIKRREGVVRLNGQPLTPPTPRQCWRNQLTP